MTTTPRIETVLIITRIRSTAAWSAAILSPRPIQRAAPIAAASVTRTNSSARLRSGPTLTASILARDLYGRSVTWLVEDDERAGRENEETAEHDRGGESLS